MPDVYEVSVGRDADGPAVSQHVGDGASYDVVPVSIFRQRKLCKRDRTVTSVCERRGYGEVEREGWLGGISFLYFIIKNDIF